MSRRTTPSGSAQASPSAARAVPPRAGRRERTPGPDGVAAYKAILRECIDRRPSGLRARLAGALGKHKSFVSQLTNPVYPMPIPARHLPAIFEVCHFSPGERRAFLHAYALAHPPRRAAERPRANGPGPARTTLTLEIPALGDPRRQRALEDLLRELADDLAELLG